MRFSKVWILGVVVLLVGIVVVATAQEKAAEPAKASTASSKSSTSSTGATKLGAKTIIGEVIDPACWVINGAKGEAHKECMIACAKSGQTLAILEKKTNKIYILATERPGDDPNRGVIDYAGQTVLVKGKVFSRGGLIAVQVASVEPYSAAKASR
jgi:hypothetical protein